MTILHKLLSRMALGGLLSVGIVAEWIFISKQKALGRRIDYNDFLYHVLCFPLQAC